MPALLQLHIQSAWKMHGKEGGLCIFFFHVQRVPVKNIRTSNIFLLIFVFSMHPHLQFMDFIFKRPRLWRPGFIAGTKKNQYSPKGHLKINQSHRCQQCLKRQEDRKHDLTFDASKLHSNCYFHFHFGLFSCTLAFSKSAFAYPSTNPAFSRLAFISFPLDFCCTAADSYFYYIIQNKLQKPNLHILLPNRTQPFCYIKTSNAFWPFSTNCSQKQQKHHQPFKASKFIKLWFSMGRESSDPTMASSSIALLQERFRQLQKVKERREEQQILKMLSETDHHHQRVGSTRHFEPTSSISPADHSLSLGLNVHARQVDHCATKTQPSTISWPNNTTAASAASASKCFDNSDLDTSLHL